MKNYNSLVFAESNTRSMNSADPATRLPDFEIEQNEIPCEFLCYFKIRKENEDERRTLESRFRNNKTIKKLRISRGWLGNRVKYE